MSRGYRVVDFLPRYRKSLETKEKKGGSRGWLRFMPLVLLVLVFGGIFGYQKYQIKQTEDSIASLRAYIDSADTKAKLQQVRELTAQTQELSADITAIEELNGYIASFSAPGMSDYSAVLASDSALFGMNITAWSYNRSGAALTLQCEAEMPGASAIFAGNLRRSGAFMDVAYYGYTLKNTGLYEFSVICYLKAVG